MEKELDTIKKLLGVKEKDKTHVTLINKLNDFESAHGLLIPSDLIEYFKSMDNAVYELNKDLFQFYGFDDFKSVEQELGNWGGVPNYTNLVNTLHDSKDCFVFADYMSHLFAYAIRLYKTQHEANEIYLICGEQFKVIANSFSEFLGLYLDDSDELKNI